MSLTTENLVHLEQRYSKRVSTLKKGKIIFDDGHRAVECTVRNTSETGAGLQLSGYMEVPPTFTLAIEGGAKRQCAVVWSVNDKVGVSYTDSSDRRPPASPRNLLLDRVRLIQDQLDELRQEIEISLAP